MNTSTTILRRFFQNGFLSGLLRKWVGIMLMLFLAGFLNEISAQIDLPDIDVRGNGISIVCGDPTPSTADGTDFGWSDVGVTGNSRQFKIYNTGTATLTLKNTPAVQIVGLNPTDFYSANIYSTTLAPGAYLDLDLTFTPGGAGLRTAKISIQTNDSDEDPFTFIIQGTGMGKPDIDIRGHNVSIANFDQTPSLTDGTDFGSANVGETQGQIWEIYNTGTATLHLTGAPIVQIYGTNAADFYFANIYSTTLAPGEHTEVDMAFTPSGPGLRTAYITILSNAVDVTPYYFGIQGTGIGIPDIEVRGNTISIQNHDGTPSTA
ncbi:choice-of-anchor D domain-containing protein, partial [candidate division KSB1 bacterium]|nr:choice-of-anchor D domain-containing protein [candidate division KSB1 bacterium]